MNIFHTSQYLYSLLPESKRVSELVPKTGIGNRHQNLVKVGGKNGPKTVWVMMLKDPYPCYQLMMWCTLTSMVVVP